MKNYQHSLAILSLLLVVVSPGVAQETGTTPTAIDEVLELYGVTEQVEQLAGMLLASLDQQQAQLDPEVYRVLRNAFEFTFTSEKLYNRLAASFAEQANEAQLARTLTWLQTPLSRKMTGLELAANTREAMAGLQKYSALIESQPPPQPRRALIERFDETVGATRLALEVQVAVLRALLEGANSLLPQERQSAPEQVDSLVTRMRAQFQEPLRQQVQVSLLYTYREVSDDELAEYLTYWETEDGHWLNWTTSRALLAAIGEVSREAGTLIGLQGVDVTPSN